MIDVTVHAPHLAAYAEQLEADRTIRMGIWRLFPAIGHPLYPELGGQTIGIVGLGRIGRAVARLAGAFGMRRLGVDINPPSDEDRRALGLDRADDLAGADRMSPASDFVVIATTLGAPSGGAV